MSSLDAGSTGGLNFPPFISFGCSLTKVSHFRQLHLLNDVLVITSETDPLLIPFLAASDADQEVLLLAHLNTEHVEPTVRPILGYKLQLHLRPGELNQRRADIERSITTSSCVLRRLHALKQDPTNKPITNLHNYVATIARNTCDDYLRRKYPLRRSLKDKVRHCLASHPSSTLEDKVHGWFRRSRLLGEPQSGFTNRSRRTVVSWMSDCELNCRQ